MKILTGGRGSGITTQLIEQSAQFNIPILAQTENACSNIKNMAKVMNLTIPEPINFSNDARCFAGKTFPNGIIIDNIESFLGKILYGKRIDAKIDTIGITI